MKKTSELQVRNNKALLCYTVVAVILLVAYVLEIVKGARSIVYFGILAATIVIPFILCFLMYKKNPHGNTMRLVLTIGYFIMYGYVLFTNNNNLVFTYIIPLMVISTFYSERKFTLTISIIAIAMNIGYMVMCLVLHLGTEISVFEIQIAVLGILAFFLTQSSIITETLNKQKVDVIEENAAKQKSLLDKILNATNNISNRVSEVNTESEKMSSQSEETQNAIDQIVSGSTELAENIQEQLEMTANINTLIQEMESDVESTQENFDVSLENIEQGNENMKHLEGATVLSEDACKTVTEAMNNLVREISNTKQALELINSITSQTSLLSLNASIEAARAGEAGRGFAVVASEIQSLAVETTNATKEIEEVFGMLENQSNIAKQSIQELEEANDKQKEILALTSQNFENIRTNMESMSENISKQSDEIKAISDSNSNIGSKISDLSAFSQELLANTESTKHLTDSTITSINTVSSSVEDIMSDISELNNTTSNHQKENDENQETEDDAQVEETVEAEEVEPEVTEEPTTDSEQ